MSTINSLSAYGLSQYYQNISINGTSQQPTTDPNTTPDPTTSTNASTATNSTTDPTLAGASTQVGMHHHHGGHDGGGGGGGEFFKKLQSAVTSALQDAQSDDSSDPNAVVTNAIAKMLQDGNTPDAAASTTDSTDPNPTDSTSSTDDPQQSFFQQLQSFGIDPQQFHQDFLSAIQTAQSGTGTTDASSVFANVPPGTFVDTTA